jgi:dTDP-4-amino-4,6-dideoxygalactose transaminase
MPLAQQIAPYLEEIDAAGYYSNFGPLVRRLEQRLADNFSAPVHVITTSSGTLALTLALRALGAPAGSLCALPSWTFVATAHAVRDAGLTPWFIDVDARSWALDPDRVREMLARAPGPIGAVAPVSPFGQKLDLEAWRLFHRGTGVPVVVDAAAGFDTLCDGQIPAIVSLHATKVLGAGEGGFFVTQDEKLAARVREQSTFGFRGDRVAQIAATNAKMSEYAAAVALAGLEGWAVTRMRYMLAAQRMRVALSCVPEVTLQEGWGLHWISGTCVARTPDGMADHVARALDAAGIATRRWWGAGCHDNPAFASFPRESLPVTARLAASTIGLPFACVLADTEIDRIAEALKRAFHR